MPNDHCDLIVIGSGPGGASLAHRLTLTVIANALRVADRIEERLG